MVTKFSERPCAICVLMNEMPPIRADEGSTYCYRTNRPYGMCEKHEMAHAQEHPDCVAKTMERLEERERNLSISAPRIAHRIVSLQGRVLK